MEKPPKISLEIKTPDYLVEIPGWALLAFLWGIVIFNYSDMPHTIPTHFSISGKPDNYGNKNFLFFLPVIGTILFLGMTLLTRFPQKFNYPVKIAEEIAERQYINAIRAINYFKFIILLLFLLISAGIIQTAYDNSSGIGRCFLPLLLVLVIIPVIYFIIRSIRMK